MRRLRIIHLFFSGHLEMNPMQVDDIKAMNTYFKGETGWKTSSL